MTTINLHPVVSSQRQASTSSRESETTHRWEELEQASKQVLSSSSSSNPALLQDLLEQWHDAINNNNNNEMVLSAVERMQDLYDSWLATQHRRHDHTQRRSHRPHQIMLQAYAHAASMTANRCKTNHKMHLDQNDNDNAVVTSDSSCIPYSQRALDVMNRWNETLGGDLELAPLLDDYHVLLDVLRQTHGSDVPARVALEVLEHLNEAGYDMTPNWTTLRLVTDCFVTSLLSHDDDNGNKADLEFLRHGLLQVLSKVELSLPTNMASSDKPLEVVYIFCNAIVATSSVSRHKETPTHAHMEWMTWFCGLQDLLASFEQRELLLSIADRDDALDDLCERLDMTLTRVLQMTRSLPWADRESVMNGLLEPFQSMFPTELPTLQHYLLAILAWKGVGGRTASDNRYKLLELMEKKFEALKQAELESALETIHWNLFMEANYYAGKPQRVRQLWKEMTANTRIRRNHKSFSVLLKALAEIGTIPAAQQAMSIWEKTWEKKLVNLTAREYASVMVAWSRSRHAEAAEKCRFIFDQLKHEATNDPSMKPTVIHYSTLISASTSMSPLEARRILEEMKVDGVMPDVGIYQTILKSLSRLGTIEAAEMAEGLLSELENDSSLVPSASCYVSAMFAWSAIPGGLVKCESILHRLETLVRLGGGLFGALDSLPYRAMVDAWIKHDSTAAGEAADKILVRVKQAAQEGIALAPDNKLYASVMMAHWKSSPETSSATINRLESLVMAMNQAHAAGNHSARPDAQCMTILLHAYAKSNIPSKATIAWNLLQQMMTSYQQDGDLDSKPTAHAFAAVLNACAFTRDNSQEAVHIALQVMTTLADGAFDRPNSYIYFNFFQVVGRQLEDVEERNRIAQVVFQRCSSEGHVNARVLSALRDYIPDLYKKLPMDESTKRLRLPAEWSRNAKA